MKTDLIIVAGLLGMGVAAFSVAVKIRAKSGVELDGLNIDVMAQALRAANLVSLFMIGTPAVITSGTEGEHMVGSRHPGGEAIDVRRVDRKETGSGVEFPDEALALQQTRRIRDRVGVDYDVVLESTHVHIEYDPETIV